MTDDKRPLGEQSPAEPTGDGTAAGCESTALPRATGGPTPSRRLASCQRFPSDCCMLHAGKPRCIEYIRGTGPLVDVPGTSTIYEEQARQLIAAEQQRASVDALLTIGKAGALSAVIDNCMLLMDANTNFEYLRAIRDVARFCSAHGKEPIQQEVLNKIIDGAKR